MALGSINLREIMDDRASSRFQIILLVLLCGFMCVEGYDMQVMSYAAPAIIKSLHASKAAFGAVFSSAMVGFVVGAFLIGNIDTKLGRKQVIVAGLIVFGLFTLATAWADDIPELVVLRAIAGIGMGSAAPNAVALMADYSPTRRRTVYVCLLYLGYTTGSAVGGLIAAKLIPQQGWQSVFVLGGLLPLIIAALLGAGLPDSIRLMALRAQMLGVRPPGRLYATLRRLRPDLDIADHAEIIVGEEIRPGMPARHLFTNGRALISILLWVDGIGNNMTHYFISSWMPTVLTSSGVGMSKAILAGSALQVMGSIGSLAIGFAVDRFGPVALAGLLALGVPVVMALGFVGDSESLLMGLVGGCGFFIIGGQTGLNGVAGTIYPTFMRSTGAGWTNGIGRIGGVISPIVGGVLLSLMLPLREIFTIAAIPLALAALSIFVLSQLPQIRAQRREAAVEKMAAFQVVPLRKSR